MRRLQAAAQHQVLVQQQTTAQQQALSQQQALAQKIAFAQIGQAATAQGFVQPLQQHNQMHPQQCTNNTISRRISSKLISIRCIYSSNMGNNTR